MNPRISGTLCRNLCIRQYATKKGRASGDSRDQLIQKIMYPQDSWETLTSDDARLKSLSQVVPSAEVDDTIWRAWQLSRRHKREQQQADLRARYEALESALKMLENTDKRLFDLATSERISSTRGTGNISKDQELSKEGRLPGLFPRQLPIPTHSSGKAAWDSTWKRPGKSDSTSS